MRDGILPPLPQFLGTTNNTVEETDATNELINDDEFVQPLTLDEIEALKKSGVHASVRPRPYLGWSAV